MPVFQQSKFRWKCDRCGVFFAAGKGGVCPSCKRALCNAHLYDSLLARLRVGLFGGTVICPECRSRGS